MLDDQYMTAFDRWGDSAFGPYGGGVGQPALPNYRPSVLRDLRAGFAELEARLFRKGWSSRLDALVPIFLGLLAIGAFHYAYWAQWEKLAWYWSRTDAQEQLRLAGVSRPPKSHRIIAGIVGSFWGVVGMLLTAVLWVAIGTIARFL